MLQNFLRNFFDYCEQKLIDRFEYTFAIFALIGFIAHVVAISLAKVDVITNDTLHESSFITTLATPFTIFLIYEIYLLAFSFTRSLLNFLLLQFQVISLIFIRELFKTFAEIEQISNGSLISIIDDIILDLSIGVILFLAVRILLFLINSGRITVPQDSQKTVRIKQLISLGLLVGVTIALFDYLFQFTLSEFIVYISEGFSLNPFFQTVFTLMILADVVVFILSILDSEGYLQVFRNAVYLISTIVIRLSLSADHPYDAYFVLIGLTAGFAITLLDMKFKEWESKYQPNKENMLGC